MSQPCPCRGCTLAYKAGFEDGKKEGYREGYNGHAHARAVSEAVFGRFEVGKQTVTDAIVGGVHVSLRTERPFNQHGEGENP